MYSAIVSVSVHLGPAILAVFFSRLIPTALSGDDKAARRATPLVPAKMRPPPMHHRRNVSGWEAGDHRYEVCVLTVMCNMSHTTWMRVVVLAFQHRLTQRITVDVFIHRS